MTTDSADLPDLYVLATARDFLAGAVLDAAARRGVRALLCSRYDYAAVLTVNVGRSGVRVTPDRPVLVRQHASGAPEGPDAGFIAEEIHAHVTGGLSLQRRPVVNRPRIHGLPVLHPPALAQYQLRASGTLPRDTVLAPELLLDRVDGGASGWEVQDLCTHESALGDGQTRRETPQRLRRRVSRPFRYVPVLVAGTRTWVQGAGAADPLARTARLAAAEIARVTELQLAEVTFKAVEDEDSLEVARVDSNPQRFDSASVVAEAADALLDLLIAA